MEDTGTCPYCRKDFTVTRYGLGIRCPYCRRKVNIFPDPKICVYTQSGVYAIGMAQSADAPPMPEISRASKQGVKGFLRYALMLIRFRLW